MAHRSVRSLRWDEGKHPRDDQGKFARKGSPKWMARVLTQVQARFGDISMGAAPGHQPQGRLQSGKGGLLDTKAMSAAAPRTAPPKKARRDSFELGPASRASSHAGGRTPSGLKTPAALAHQGEAAGPSKRGRVPSGHVGGAPDAATNDTRHGAITAAESNARGPGGIVAVRQKQAALGAHNRGEATNEWVTAEGGAKKDRLIQRARMALGPKAYGSSPESEMLSKLSNTPVWDGPAMDKAAAPVQKILDDMEKQKADLGALQTAYRARVAAVGGLAEHEPQIRADMRAVKKSNKIPGDAAIRKLPPEKRWAAEEAVRASENLTRARMALQNNQLQARLGNEMIAEGKLSPTQSAELTRQIGRLSGPSMASQQGIEMRDAELQQALLTWHAVQAGDAGKKGDYTGSFTGLEEEQRRAVQMVGVRTGDDAAHRLAKEFRRKNGTSEPAQNPKVEAIQEFQQAAQESRAAGLPEGSHLMPGGRVPDSVKRANAQRQTEKARRISTASVSREEQAGALRGATTLTDARRIIGNATIGEMDAMAETNGWLGGTSKSWAKPKWQSYLMGRAVAGDLYPEGLAPAAMARALQQATSREQAFAILDVKDLTHGVTKADMQKIADHIVGGRAATLRGSRSGYLNDLVELAAGRNLDSNAIARVTKGDRFANLSNAQILNGITMRGSETPEGKALIAEAHKRGLTIPKA